MVNNIILVFVLLMTIVSCSVEQVNLSPAQSSYKEKVIGFQKEVASDIEGVNYMSELSDIVSYIPQFKNDKVNQHIEKMKIDITEYIYAVREYNRVGEERYFDRLQSDFKKISKFKNLMSDDEYQLLTSYLVKVKSNISLLKSKQK